MVEIVDPPDTDNVITVGFGSETEIKRTHGFCLHNVYVVDETTRSITCRTCHAVLDPFKVLLEYARKERSWRHAQKAERDVCKRIAELEAEERRVKARVRSAKRKDANAAVAEERKRTRQKLHDAVWKANEIGRLAAAVARALGDEHAQRVKQEIDAEDAHAALSEVLREC